MSPVPICNITPAYVKCRNSFRWRKERYGPVRLRGDPGGEARNLFSSQASDQQHELLLHPQAESKSSIQMRSKDRGIGTFDDVDIGTDNTNIAALPPIWVDIVVEAEDDIGKIKMKMSSLQKLQQRRFLKVFGDESQISKPDHEIESTSQSITELFHQCEQKLQNLEKEFANDDIPTSEFKLRQNAHYNTLVQLQTISRKFRKQQRHYLNELKKRSQLEDDVTSTGDGAGDDDSQQDALLQDMGTTEREMHSRNEEISTIARSIADLHYMFKDLAVRVIDQGTIMDRVDYNLETTVERTSKAVEELKKAESHSTRGCLTKCTFILLGANALLTIMVIVKYVMRFSNKGS